MSNASGPYSIGYNGHAKACDCDACAKKRARDLVARARERSVKAPAPDATIFVRAHFRRGRYLTKAPKTLGLYRVMLRKEFARG